MPYSSGFVWIVMFSILCADSIVNPVVPFPATNASNLALLVMKMEFEFPLDGFGGCSALIVSCSEIKTGIIKRNRSIKCLRIFLFSICFPLRIFLKLI